MHSGQRCVGGTTGHSPGEKPPTLEFKVLMSKASVFVSNPNTLGFLPISNWAKIKFFSIKTMQTNLTQFVMPSRIQGNTKTSSIFFYRNTGWRSQNRDVFSGAAGNICQTQDLKHCCHYGERRLAILRLASQDRNMPEDAAQLHSKGHHEIWQRRKPTATGPEVRHTQEAHLHLRSPSVWGSTRCCH